MSRLWRGNNMTREEIELDWEKELPPDVKQALLAMADRHIFSNYYKENRPRKFKVIVKLRLWG